MPGRGEFLMLVGTSRCRPDDLEAWAIAERKDAVWATLSVHKRRVQKASAIVAAFRHRAHYAGVSWGKDSTVLAHLVVGTGIPLVWVRVEPLLNPDCLLVRDAFLRAHDVPYHEIVVHAERGPDGRWLGTGRLEEGFAKAVQQFGPNYLSGVRGQESHDRKMRMKIHGHESKHTCVPLGYWTADDVYAYLHAHGLPVHPAYACTMGGALDRDWLRVATLGGDRGTEQGRRAWEFNYYPDEMRAIFSGYRHVEGL